VTFEVVRSQQRSAIQEQYATGAVIDPNADYLSFKVSDNGQGITADLIPDIFKERISDQSGMNWEGTGLGLSVCEYLCLQMGWSIS